MILDGILILILLISVIMGKKTGLFRAVTRMLSTVLAIILTILLQEKVLLFLEGTPLYASILEKLAGNVEKMTTNGQIDLLKPFMALGNVGAADIAGEMAESIVPVLIFILLYIGIKLLISVLDKTIFHLPLVKPINKILGSLWNGIFTLFIVYLVIGVAGGLSLFSTNAFLAAQMEESFLVHGMYTNNIVLNFLFKKG